MSEKLRKVIGEVVYVAGEEFGLTGAQCIELEDALIDTIRKAVRI